MIGSFARYVVPAHRVLLVLTTVLIGIYASLLTTDPGCVAYWLACCGAALGMYESDVYREVDANAFVVAAKGDHELVGVRDDLFRASAPRRHLVLFGISLALMIIGIVFGA